MQRLEFPARRISHKKLVAASPGEVVGRVGNFLRDIQTLPGKPIASPMPCEQRRPMVVIEIHTQDKSAIVSDRLKLAH
jgi:hypothetical protein